MGGQVTSLNIMKATFLASFASLLIPLIFASFYLRRDKAELEQLSEDEMKKERITTPFEQKLLFFLGGASLLSVPVFKAVTHMPPYMGIVLSVGVLW